jgi:hypothetical protein
MSNALPPVTQATNSKQKQQTELTHSDRIHAYMMKWARMKSVQKLPLPHPRETLYLAYPKYPLPALEIWHSISSFAYNCNRGWSHMRQLKYSYIQDLLYETIRLWCINPDTTLPACLSMHPCRDLASGKWKLPFISHESLKTLWLLQAPTPFNSKQQCKMTDYQNSDYYSLKQH